MLNIWRVTKSHCSDFWCRKKVLIVIFWFLITFKLILIINLVLHLFIYRVVYLLKVLSLINMWRLTVIQCSRLFNRLRKKSFLVVFDINNNMFRLSWPRCTTLLHIHISWLIWFSVYIILILSFWEIITGAVTTLVIYLLWLSHLFLCAWIILILWFL